MKLDLSPTDECCATLAPKLRFVLLNSKANYMDSKYKLSLIRAKYNNGEISLGELEKGEREIINDFIHDVWKNKGLKMLECVKVKTSPNYFDDIMIQNM
jgi:hypothetical protein